MTAPALDPLIASKPMVSFLEQAVEDAPGEGAERTTALQRERQGGRRPPLGATGQKFLDGSKKTERSVDDGQCGGPLARRGRSSVIRASTFDDLAFGNMTVRRLEKSVAVFWRVASDCATAARGAEAAQNALPAETTHA